METTNTPKKLTFQTGEHVRYGGNGICLIDSLTERTNPDDYTTRLYYVLKPLRNTNMTMFVPTDSEQLCSKMQPLHSKDEIDRMLAEALEKPIMPWIEERKLRGAEFRRILSAGDAPGLLQMIRCILKRQADLQKSRRHLSAMDDIMRKDAERMLDEEFAFSMGITSAEAGRYITSRLNGTSSA